MSNADKYNWIKNKNSKSYIPNTDPTNNMNMAAMEAHQLYRENQIRIDLEEQKNNEYKQFSYFFTEKLPENIGNAILLSILKENQLVEHDKTKKLSIIIPYRDREDHLKELLTVLPNILNSQGIKYTVSIIEQEGGKPFNRGMLCNIGLLETPNFDYYCFHDVDMIPIYSDYGYSIHMNKSFGLAFHLAKNVEQFDYKPISGTYFGGVLCMDSLAIKLTNGFSNNYWGWGFEDDDLFRRCFNQQKIITVWRSGIYKSMNHSHNYNQELYEKNKKIYAKFTDSANDGINQTKYKVISKNSIDSKTTIITVSV